jgi:hypothetical protein
MTPKDMRDEFLEWCRDNDDIPIVRGYLGSLDCMHALDRQGTPKRFYDSAMKIRDHLEELIVAFRENK